MPSKFQIEMRLPDGSDGAVKSSAGEALLGAAAACAKAWTELQGLKGADGAPLDPLRAVRSELEYDLASVKLTVWIQNRGLEALVPHEANQSIGAISRAKRNLDGSGIALKDRLALTYAKIVLPKEAFKEILDKARSGYLFEVAASVHVPLLSKMAKAALPAVRAKLLLAGLLSQLESESSQRESNAPRSP